MPIPGRPQAIAPPVAATDRSAPDRDLPDAIATLTNEPGARALWLRGGRAPLDRDGSLLLVDVTGTGGDQVVAFLGRRDARPVLLALAEDPPVGGGDASDDAAPIGAPGGWAELREVGGALAAADAALFGEALALARWIRDAAFCPACGARTELRQAGWSRQCPACGREHFPRTDPAAIVAVTDGTRLLLGSNAAWPAGRYSCFAGFIEAGESAEGALVREIEEEAGVRIDALQYIGSQAWPYPRSLMLGYLASTSNSQAARPDGQEIVDVRWFEAHEIADALAGRGDVTLPGSSSISRALIERWLEQVTAA